MHYVDLVNSEAVNHCWVRAGCELMLSACITGIVVALKEPKWDLSIRSICVPFVFSEWNGVLLLLHMFVVLSGRMS